MSGLFIICIFTIYHHCFPISVTRAWSYSERMTLFCLRPPILACYKTFTILMIILEKVGVEPMLTSIKDRSLYGGIFIAL